MKSCLPYCHTLLAVRYDHHLEGNGGLRYVLSYKQQYRENITETSRLMGRLCPAHFRERQPFAAVGE